MFPKYRIARMDVDSVKGKTAHDNLIQQFEQQKLDMLVGTQMVVKGLDFEHVELVGILDADSLLSFADFRVNERAFQLMEQVSGRAGRKDEQGHVMIQVSNTRHPVLGYVQQHDYHSFYLYEMEGRKQFAYPPFSRCILLTFKHYVKDAAEAAANSIAASLKTEFGNYLVGPAEPVVNRVRNQYLMELLIKLPREARIIQRCKQQIQEQIAIMHQHQRFKKVVVIVDVDTM
ncbi:helicase-related protein [Paraflavitalea speifideaquila]|uniref:helicase-related protein n=1 Tax=Paraflavitalea speifideaquila TaxID=3076558 RepID=UPI0028E3C354|nr:helicase-related protein [Paraflavitalea speifideiaquila]